MPQVKAFHKIQGRLTRELEKKVRFFSPFDTCSSLLCLLISVYGSQFSDRHVVFIGQRRMMRKPTRVSRVKQQRPRSRTLKEVHEKILEDLVFPTVSCSCGVSFSVAISFSESNPCRPSS